MDRGGGAAEHFDQMPSSRYRYEDLVPSNEIECGLPPHKRATDSLAVASVQRMQSTLAEHSAIP